MLKFPGARIRPIGQLPYWEGIADILPLCFDSLMSYLLRFLMVDATVAVQTDLILFLRYSFDFP